jgi:hypothetical protein
MLRSIDEVVFTTKEAQGLRWTGYTKDEAKDVFAEWVRSNLDWVSVGVEPMVAVEILEVNFDLVSFNGQVAIAYLCAECATNDCEADGEAHETFVDNCRFDEQTTYQRR